eukprot:COSAG05_NODE_1720_length_4216_cov_4.328394_1_plen_100_part_00
MRELPRERGRLCNIRGPSSSAGPPSLASVPRRSAARLHGLHAACCVSWHQGDSLDDSLDGIAITAARLPAMGCCEGRKSRARLVTLARLVSQAAAHPLL